MIWSSFGRRLVALSGAATVLSAIQGAALSLRNRFTGYTPLYNLNGAMTEGGGTDLSVQHIYDMGDITLPTGASIQHCVMRFAGIARNGDAFETAGAKFISFNMDSYNADAYGAIGTLTLKTGTKEVKALYGRASLESTTGGVGVALVGGVTIDAAAAPTAAWPLQLTLDGAGSASSVGRFVSLGSDQAAKIAAYCIYSDPKIGYQTAFIRAWNSGAGQFLKWQSPDVGAGHIDLFVVEKLGHVRGILGSVGAPTYAFLGDTNTGMYSTAADEVAFAAAGAQVLRLRAVGGGATTSMVLGVNNTAGVNNVSVTLGAVDSGGAGFRVLRVPN